ncbi:invasion associated locus B family protein, partial [Neorhizobium sp. T786]|uniref:invasion associated locus B family protein n=1 Tax=Pseudorhizobium xiangyangii TaxID=2883104 RepID=UPI001CFF7605
AGGPFPHGASSLREQHGDWTVICSTGKSGDEDVKSCILQQEQVRQVTNGPSQRVLAIEFQRNAKGLEGVLVLPLGLNLVDGAVLQIDGNKAMEPRPFRTCLYAGCIVNVTADDKMVAGLAKGKAMTVKTTNNEGKATEFSISLAGFQAALERASDLVK